MSRLDVWLADRPVHSVDVQDDVTALDMQEIAGALAGRDQEFEIRGFAGGRLVAAYRNDLDNARRTVRSL